MPGRRPSETRATTVTESRAYLAKAEEFLRAA